MNSIGACRVEFTGARELDLTLKNGQKSRYTWLPPLKDRPSQTHRYAGEYFCAELDASHKIIVKKKALHLLLKGETEQLEMQQVKKDLFKAGPSVIIHMNTPARDKFTLKTGRVKGLVFTKK